MGLRVGLLSGDSTQAVARVAALLGFAEGSWRARVSPEGKRTELAKHARALMVGDGANDAAALARAYVGVAVHGGVEVSLRSSDVYFRTPGIHALPDLLVVARETMKVIHRNFAFSLVYNAVGIAGVIAGVVTPLFAAILMPISALTVFLSSLAGTSRLRAALRGMGR
jgi:P-type E1-E2 ATPase